MSETENVPTSIVLKNRIILRTDPKSKSAIFTDIKVFPCALDLEIELTNGTHRNGIYATMVRVYHNGVHVGDVTQSIFVNMSKNWDYFIPND